MHANRFRVSLGTQLSPPVLEVANQLLLLCINRYRRLPRSLKLFNLSVDMFKLDYATCCLEIAERVSVIDLIPLDICLGFGLPFFVDFYEDSC